MSTITVKFRHLPNTEAALGKAGDHTIIVDRLPGKAGGRGLGFNGGELLAFAIGGCLCNDLHYVADEIGVSIETLAVAVSLEFEGMPALAKSASMQVSCALADGIDSTELIARAMERSTVSNSVAQGFPVHLERIAI